MKSVRADFPETWPHANVYTLADLHIGDPHCNDAEVRSLIDRVRDDPYGLCILNGDLMNTGAALEYGGYGQAQEFKPAAIAYPVIHLEAKHKKVTVTM